MRRENILFMSLIMSLLFFFSIRCVAKVDNQKTGNKSAKYIHGNEDKEIFSVLRLFYKDYFAALDKNGNTNIVLKQYLSASFYKTLLDLKSVQKKLNEPLVDWDIFIQAQDWDSKCLKTLNIKRDRKAQNVYVVTYLFPGDNSLVTVKLNVKKERGMNKIDGIIDKGFNDVVSAYLHRK